MEDTIMKTKKLLIAALLTVASISAMAQSSQVNTLYFLENQPYRHYINPALVPISDVYVGLPVLGYTSLWGGNNSLTVSDVVVNKNDKLMWFLNPEAGGSDQFLKRMRNSTLMDMEMQLNLLSFGFRIKDFGYFHFNLNEKADFGTAVPKGLFNFLLGGGMTNLEGINSYDLKQLGMNASLYTELSLGYSHQINEKWTVGGALKLLMGQAQLSMTNNALSLDASKDEWALRGDGNLRMTLPARINGPTSVAYNDLEAWGKGLKDQFSGWGVKDYLGLLKPAGWGAAFDLGFTYKPIEQLQISAGVTDLGFIYWKGGQHYKYNVNGVFAGVPNLEYSDLQENQQSLLDTVIGQLKDVYKNSISQQGTDNKGYARMVTAKLNVGVDANFWDNRVGVGVLSQTRFYNNQVYEEVTLGASFRPVHWFQLAASYSFLNGRWSNIGVALGLVTYEGIGLTLAADYVPTSYVKTDSENWWGVPYKTKGVNLALGLNIVIGHKRDKDRDGVKDKYDLCPNTPRGVVVDADGCPVDTDGDGVPDYLDKCPNTPVEAYDFIDEDGCPLDTDGDGVPDYKDKCPDTPQEAIGWTDADGCELDSDGDGVPDWRDKCPNTPAEAKGHVDADGCELDSDGDGVPDWRDRCPDTPKEAINDVDENGCNNDDDGDGVPNYLDKCPDTPQGARGYVDENGCEKDTDGDGVPDWRDRCPDTEKGVTVDEYGCNGDTDGDGVPDVDDKCPDTPQGVKVDAEGCPIDSDGDGVPDYLDECPDTPKEASAVRTLIDEKGCEKDTDGDGVPDWKDVCPTIPGTKANSGCPEIKREVRELLTKAMQGIQFETNKAIIKPVSFPILDQIAQTFIDNPTWLVEVQGHTDNVGKADYNQNLSERRANSVRDYLVGKGVPAEKLTAKGYGLTKPIADNKTADGRKQNRRVEFVITFEEVSYETIRNTPTADSDSIEITKENKLPSTEENAE